MILDDNNIQFFLDGSLKDRIHFEISEDYHYDMFFINIEANGRFYNVELYQHEIKELIELLQKANCKNIRE